jgi:hypothetical protein
VNVGGNWTETFAVREERVYDQTMSVSSITPDVIATFLQNKGTERSGPPPARSDRAKETRDSR